MTQDERFEFLWESHTRQINENRAVSQHMDDIRENVTDLQERMNKVCNFLHKIEDNEEMTESCHKMSFLLGLSWVCVRASHEALRHVNCMMPNHYHEAYQRLINGIQELFYSDKV